MNEGGADYERGIWDPLDLMTVRDAAVADIVPRMSQMEGYGDFGNPRLVYNLGHALYEFIEARWGKEGVRQFLFSLRKSAIGGGSSPYEEAFQMTAREFDQQFEKYLKDRFKAFRDKERPADYGQDLSPDPEKTALHERDLDRAVAVGRPHRGGDRQPARPGARHHPRLVEGRRRSSATSRPGFDMDRGFEYLATPSRVQHGAVDVVVAGRRSHRVLRAQGKAQDAHHPERADRQDRAPHRHGRRSTSRSRRTSRPTAARWSSAALRNAIGDILQARPQHRRHHQPHQRRVRRLRARATRPTASSWSTWRASADRRSCSGSTWTGGKKTQLTFGTQDEAAAKFLDRRHADLPVDGDRSGDAAHARRGAQRQHLQPVVAQPEERRAASSTPMRSAACSRRSCSSKDGRGAEARVRRLLQGRTTASTRSI